MGEGCWVWHSHTAGVKTREESVELIDCGGLAGVLFVVGNCSDPLPHAAVVDVLKMLVDLHFICSFGSSNPSSHICSASPVSLAVT